MNCWQKLEQKKKLEKIENKIDRLLELLENQEGSQSANTVANSLVEILKRGIETNENSERLTENRLSFESIPHAFHHSYN